MGSLLPESGYDDFLKAWRIVQKKVPNAKLIVIGGTDLYELNRDPAARKASKLKKLEDRVLRNRGGELKSNVRLLGVLGGERKLEAMRSAAVGVSSLTPAGETFGLSVVEFQALGIPVVSRNFRGIRDTVINGKSGILVKDHRALAEAVAELLRRREACEEYGSFGAACVRERFSIDRILDEWESCLRNLGQAAEAPEPDLRRYTYDGKLFIYLNAGLRKRFPALPSHLRYIKIQKEIGKRLRPGRA